MNEPGGADSFRIGTHEREDTIQVLGEHFAAGRLPMDEYERRVDAAANAVTKADLRALFNDLPAPYPQTLNVPIMPAPPPPMMNAPYPPPPPQYHHHMYAPVPYSDKSRVVAGLLQILLPFGVGRFYMGNYGIAIAQLLTCGLFGVWCWIDGIIILVSGGRDGEGRPLRDL